MQDPITDVREISRIAYGFKASKALLVAIDLDLFSRLSGGTKSLVALANELDIAENRLDTLLTALTSIGLLVRNGDAFVADPQKYAPQFGGYCAWAVSQGYTAGIDPEAWTIHGGRLYLNYSKGVQAQWSEDIPGNIAKGERNWPKVLGN